MDELKQRFIEDLQLQGLSESTQRSYVLAMEQLEKHHGQSPAELSEEQVREFFLYLTNERRISRNTMTIKLSAIKLLFEKTLKRDWPTFDLVKPKKIRKLPLVLSKDKIKDLLVRVKDEKARMCLTMLYCCGLRISEGVKLQVSHIDSDRMAIRVDQGKRCKDRYVPLPHRTLELLRDYWRIERPSTYLFGSNHACGHVQPATIRCVFKAAIREGGFNPKVSPHTLRHCYATHLYERGVPLAVIQRLLGHRNIRTTTIYTHLTPKIVRNIHASVDALAEDL